MKPHPFFLISFSWMYLANCSESRLDEVRTDNQALELLPVKFTLRQRSTEAVPGSDGQLLVTIDDVTRNQVMVSVATAGGELLLPQRSMSPVAAAEFGFEGQSLILRLTELHNALVGDDFAKFHLSDAGVEAAEGRKKFTHPCPPSNSVTAPRRLLLATIGFFSGCRSVCARVDLLTGTVDVVRKFPRAFPACSKCSSSC